MGLVANITAGFVRVRNEINIIKQALQNVSGAQPATTSQVGVARFATQTETYNSNALVIPKPQDIRSFISQQLAQVVTNIVTPFAFPFDGDGSTVLFIQPLSLANISLEGASVTVYRYVGNPDTTLAYLEIVPDSEIQYKRIYNPSAAFPDNPVFHIMFTVAPTVNDSFIVSIYGR